MKRLVIPGQKKHVIVLLGRSPVLVLKRRKCPVQQKFPCQSWTVCVTLLYRALTMTATSRRTVAQSCHHGLNRGEEAYQHVMQFPFFQPPHDVTALLSSVSVPQSLSRNTCLQHLPSTRRQSAPLSRNICFQVLTIHVVPLKLFSANLASSLNMTACYLVEHRAPRSLRGLLFRRWTQAMLSLALKDGRVIAEATHMLWSSVSVFLRDGFLVEDLVVQQWDKIIGWIVTPSLYPCCLQSFLPVPFAVIRHSWTGL